MGIWTPLGSLTKAPSLDAICTATFVSWLPSYYCTDCSSSTPKVSVFILSPGLRDCGRFQHPASTWKTFVLLTFEIYGLGNIVLYQQLISSLLFLPLLKLFRRLADEWATLDGWWFIFGCCRPYNPWMFCWGMKTTTTTGRKSGKFKKKNHLVRVYVCSLYWRNRSAIKTDCVATLSRSLGRPPGKCSISLLYCARAWQTSDGAAGLGAVLIDRRRHKNLYTVV